MGGLRLVHRHKDVGCIAPCCSWAGEDALDLVPRYPLSDSSFYDCLAIDSYGEGGDSLPKALQPRLGLKFTRLYRLQTQALFIICSACAQAGVKLSTYRLRRRRLCGASLHAYAEPGTISWR